MPNPIYSIGAKRTDGNLVILKAGLSSDVRDAVAREIYKENPESVFWVSLVPSFDVDTMAGAKLAELAEAPAVIDGMLKAGETLTGFSDGSAIVISEASGLNPERMDPSVIPPGPYCYRGRRERREGEPEFTEDGRPIHYLNYCPYMSSRDCNGVVISWCNFLNKGSIDGSARVPNDREKSEAVYEEEHRKLVEHFGSEEALEEATPLDLLWDSCKECGINDADEAEPL